jgi:voltage-gated sodium channel
MVVPALAGGAAAGVAGHRPGATSHGDPFVAGQMHPAGAAPLEAPEDASKRTAAQEFDPLSDPLLQEYLDKLTRRLDTPGSSLESMFGEEEDIPGAQKEEDEKLSPIRKWLREITTKGWFIGLIATAVILNAIQMGVQCDVTGDPYDQIYVVLEYLFTIIFGAEMVIKLVAFGKNYFFSSWNLLDFFLCWLSILDIVVIPFLVGGNDKGGMQKFSVLRILRLLRVVRVARIFKFLKELWLILRGIIESFKTLVWVSLLLLVVLYICAIFCTQMIGQSNPETYADFPDGYAGADFNKEQYFGGILRSMVTLFNIVIMTGDWDVVCRAIVEKQPGMFIFFLCFIMLTTFGLMNVIIGVVVDNVISQAGEAESDFDAADRLKRVDLLKALAKACFVFDTDGDGFITKDEFEKALVQEEVRSHFDGISALPLGWESEELFWILNMNADQKLTHHEFVLSMLRLIEHDPQQQMLVLLAVMHEVMYQISRLRSEGVGGGKPNLTMVGGETKPAPVYDRPGGATQVPPGGWDWCAQQVARQGEQLDALVRLVADRQQIPWDGPAGASASPTPSEAAALVAPVGGARPPMPIGAFSAGGTYQPPPRVPPPNGAAVPGPPAGSAAAEAARLTNNNIAAPFARDAAQVRSMFASLTPRRTSPVRQAVLRQVECLQDYAATVSNGNGQGNIAPR